MKSTRFLALLLALGLTAQISCEQPARAANDASAADMKAALNLYNMRQYGPAADVFEIVIQKAHPEPRLYYYAGLANHAAGREARAAQLFQYIANNFPATQEASLAVQQLGAAQKQQQAVQAQQNKEATELPESVKAALPPGMRELLNSEQGKMAAMMAMQENKEQIKAIREGEKKIAVQTALMPKTAAPAQPAPKTGTSENPFTAADIAKDGARGIDQSRYPNCWFEASMSALAELPRGQRLLASMIKYRKNSYVVRFPGDGIEYGVTDTDLDENGIHDKARWASIIECAQLKKFPDNSGANGEDNNISRLVIGLGCITGCKAEELMLRSAGDQEISSFIGGAVKSQNPCVCATWPNVNGPMLVVPNHAYTVVGLDPAKQMIIIRNPHGVHSEHFELQSDPAHDQFEQLDDGMIKISIPIFKTYFHSVCRSFI